MEHSESKTTRSPDDIFEKDAQGWSCHLSLGSAIRAARDVRRQVEEGVLSLVPPEVTQHLVNAQKEVVRAGQRLGEIAIERLDARAARAREVHERVKARKEAASAPLAEGSASH